MGESNEQLLIEVQGDLLTELANIPVDDPNYTTHVENLVKLSGVEKNKNDAVLRLQQMANDKDIAATNRAASDLRSILEFVGKVLTVGGGITVGVLGATGKERGIAEKASSFLDTAKRIIK